MAGRKKSKGRQQGRALRLMVLLAAAIAVVAGILWFFFRPAAGPVAGVDFGSELVRLAASRGADPELIRADDPITKVDGIFVRSWRLELPSAAVVEAFLGDVFEATRQFNGRATTERSDSTSATVLLTFEREAFNLTVVVVAPVVAARATATPLPTKTPKPRPTLAPHARGKLAILLDDGGQRMDLVAAAASLPVEVSVSILPFLPYSAETAAAMHKAGHEVWLHLPVEPEGYPATNPGPGAILVGMSEDTIRTTTRSALNNIPHLKGVNNHMGSKGTTALRVMTWVMQEIKVRDLVFIDSRTHKDTIAELAAKAQGVPTNRRHVFLDNDRDPASIRASLEEAIYRARSEGEIIAIGHLVGPTVRVLTKELATIDTRGVDLVFPSSLTK